MDCSTPGFPVHHQLPELAQTHVCQVGDAIQPSHPLSSSWWIFPTIHVGNLFYLFVLFIYFIYYSLFILCHSEYLCPINMERLTSLCYFLVFLYKK